MNYAERDRHLRDTMKYNEFHKGGQKEDRTTAEIVESFGLDDKKIINPEPPTPGIWTGWFLISYRGPRPDQ